MGETCDADRSQTRIYWYGAPYSEKRTFSRKTEDKSTVLVPDSLVTGNPYNLWISIGVNDKHMDTFESQTSIIGHASV
jgi:hypothetical protein